MMKRVATIRTNNHLNGAERIYMIRLWYIDADVFIHIIWMHSAPYTVSKVLLAAVARD